MRRWFTTVWFLWVTTVPLTAGDTVRVSEAPGGGDASGRSSISRRAFSDCGRYVAFSSVAENLVPDDVNGRVDVFLADCDSGTIELLSRGMLGNGANQSSLPPSISGNGRVVAFSSGASNLVAGDDNNRADIFVFDRDRSRIEVVSVSAAREFGNGSSSLPKLSFNGRYVVFESDASNLVPGDINGHTDIFVFDRRRKAIERVSATRDDVGGDGDSVQPDISDDGRFVVFSTSAQNFVQHRGLSSILLFDRFLKRFELISVREGDGRSGSGFNEKPLVDATGRFVVFRSSSSDLGIYGNGVFLRDRLFDKTDLVSVTSEGRPCGVSVELILEPCISRDGAQVGFVSRCSGVELSVYRGAFVRDLAAGELRRVSVSGAGDAATDVESLSLGPNNLAAFVSNDPTLVEQDENRLRDVFLRDDSCAEATSVGYGEGWPGTHGTPGLYLTDPPLLGTTPLLFLSNSAPARTQAWLLVGTEGIDQPTPWDGRLFVLPQRILSLSIDRSGVLLPMALPDDLSLCGLRLYAQALEIDPGASEGLSFTQGLEVLLGN